MRAMTITAQDLAQWMVTFNKFNTKEEYQNQLQAVRCIFDFANNRDFEEEVLREAKKIMNRK